MCSVWPYMIIGRGLLRWFSHRSMLFSSRNLVSSIVLSVLWLSSRADRPYMPQSVRDGVPAESIEFFRGWAGHIFCCFNLGLLETKTERKAVNETMITATHASACCQNTSQTKSKDDTIPDVMIPDTFTMENTIMIMLRDRKAPIPSFCRVLILTFHSSRTGSVTTDAVS